MVLLMTKCDHKVDEEGCCACGLLYHHYMMPGYDDEILRLTKDDRTARTEVDGKTWHVSFDS